MLFMCIIEGEVIFFCIVNQMFLSDTPMVLHGGSLIHVFHLYFACVFPQATYADLSCMASTLACSCLSRTSTSLPICVTTKSTSRPLILTVAVTAGANSPTITFEKNATKMWIKFAK